MQIAIVGLAGSGKTTVFNTLTRGHAETGGYGALTLNVPNVTMQERMNRSYTRARFGTGGAPLQINHVNGNVRFESEAGATAATTNTVTTVISAGALPPPPPAAPAPPAQ